MISIEFDFKNLQKKKKQKKKMIKRKETCRPWIEECVFFLSTLKIPILLNELIFVHFRGKYLTLGMKPVFFWLRFSARV